MKILWRFLFLIISSAIIPLQANVIYVNAAAAAAGNGTSWANAFNSLDAALGVGVANPGDQIWIASGTYKPSLIYSPNDIPGGVAGLNTSRMKTFTLVDKVDLYGGFVGKETNISQRVPTTPPTILSGDLAGDDVNDAAHLSANKTDNVYHIVTAGLDPVQGSNNPGTGVKVTIDGITIQGGYANGIDSAVVDMTIPPGQKIPAATITSIAYAHDAGGGLYIRYGSVIRLNNVIFQFNGSDSTNSTVHGGTPGVSATLLGGGGAIFVSDTKSKVYTTNSTFTNNTATFTGGNGGAINLILNASADISSSTFSNNTANRNGGAIRGKDYGDLDISSSTFSNNTVLGPENPDDSGGAIGVIDGNLTISNKTKFDSNIAILGGGAVFFHAPFDDGSKYKLDINDSTFTNNVALFGGGAVMGFAVLPHKGTAGTIRNSTFQNNTSGEGGAIYIDSLNTTVTNSVFQGNKAELWGGAILSSNFSLGLNNDSDFADRPTVNVADSTFTGNQIIGQFPPQPFPGFTLYVLNQLSKRLGTGGLISATGGGGAMTNVLEGVLFVDNSTFTNNQAPIGGAILNGGATGDLTALDLDFAKVTHSTFTGNASTPDAYNLDLANLGPDKKTGVLLILKHNQSDSQTVIDNGEDD